MNYIKLINAFWQIRRERTDFDPYVIALFFALVDLANRREWKPFTAYREDILTLSGMSTKPYYKAREILKDAKLLHYKEGSSKITKCCFTILQPLLTATDATTVGQHMGNSSDHSTETVATTILNKPINYKLLNLKLNKSKSKFIKWFFKYSCLATYETTTWLGNKEKAKRKKVAPKKEKVQEHFFSESPYYDLQTFLNWFAKGNYPINKYPNTDLEYYHRALCRWADKGVARPRRKDWIGVAHTFIGKDEDAGTIRMKTKPSLTISTNQPAKGTPEYYAKLKEQYTFSKAS